MDELRAIYLERVGGKPMNLDDRRKQGFLLADEVVFRARAGGKSVEARYNTAEHGPINHSRFRQSQQY